MEEKRRHSAAHVLAQATKRLKKRVKLGIGPATDEGYYYDMEVEPKLTEEDLPEIEAEMRRIISEDIKIERREITRKEAEALFAGDEYKLELLGAIPEGELITTYTQGEFTDLCRGPHVESTGQIGHIKLISLAGAYFRGDSTRPQLQRIYGIAAATEGEIKEYLKLREEAARSDHRKLGQELQLYMMSEVAPGFAFIMDRGMRTIQKLMKEWRRIHREYGYTEVRTPAMMKKFLWEKSGHWGHYAAGMYTLTLLEKEKTTPEEFALKPMNCPGGIKVYENLGRQTLASPLKIAEIGQVHRREAGGTLHGLFRLREFTQDDAHIYCRPEQIESVIGETIELIGRMYATFGLTYEMELSTRPADSIGTDEIWEKAETALKKALGERPYTLNEGDGAFYGPKIDFHVRDRMRRSWQCGTIQLDFNLPERFELEYADGPELKRPVMIHRVVFGSIERFFGILTEHYGGAYPLWLNAEQVMIIPLTEEYAEEVERELKRLGMEVRVDKRNETLSKRIRDAAALKIPYTLVIGEKEAANRSVNVRTLGSKKSQTFSLSEFIEKVLAKIEDKSQDYTL